MSVSPSQFPDTLASAEHQALVLAWRRARLARLTAEHSWLSLVERAWLREGDNSVGSAPTADVKLPADRAPARLGTFTLRAGAVSFTPAPVAEHALHLRRAGDTQQLPAHEPVTLVSDAKDAPDRLLLGSLTLEVMERAELFAVRVRDSRSPARLQFPGIAHYPIELRTRVVAKLQPYASLKTLELEYENGRVEPYHVPGLAMFTLDGIELRLEPLIDTGGKRLFIPFADLTNRDTTYGAGRFLYAPLPQDGRVLLDFNQAFNPPCAFTPFAFCPLTPPQNRLAVRIEAGEKRPLDPSQEPL